MATFILPSSNNYPRESDVFQGLDERSFGYVRKTVSVTGTAGVTLLVGQLLIDNLDGTATIPANAAAVVDPDNRLCIFVGNDSYKNINNLANQSYSDNYTEFKTGNTTQDVVVVWRGAGGFGKAGLIFPAGTTSAQKQTVFDKLNTVNNLQPIRQAVVINI